MGDDLGGGMSGGRRVSGRLVGGFSGEVVGAASRTSGDEVAFSDPAFYLRFPEREGRRRVGNGRRAVAAGRDAAR